MTSGSTKKAAADPSDGSVTVRAATSAADMTAVRECFTEYTHWLDEDISFQNYTDEFDNLPGKYAPPTGALLVAVDAPSGDLLGCIALRSLQLHGEYLASRPSGLQYCELKRLYVYPRARGRQVARRLIREAIQLARRMGYDEMLLDTLPKMQAAIKLYESEGFSHAQPYYFSPLDGVIYLSLRLRPALNDESNGCSQ